MSIRNAALGMLASCLSIIGCAIGVVVYSWVMLVFDFLMPNSLLDLGFIDLGNIFESFDGTYLSHFAGGAIGGFGIVYIFHYIWKRGFPKSFYLFACIIPFLCLLATIALPFIGGPMHWKYAIQAIMAIITIIAGTKFVMEDESFQN